MQKNILNIKINIRILNINKYNKKILKYKNKDLFIILYSPWCKYCNDTFELLKYKKKLFKGYIIN